MNAIRIELIVALTVGLFASGCDSGTARESTTPQTITAAVDATVAAEKEIGEALTGLSVEDREAAKAQRFCAINVYRRLGSIGTPVKIETTGTPFFVCSEEFVEEAANGGAAIKRTANGLRKSTARLAELPPEERAAAESQKYCPVMSSRLLGTMGAPVKLVLVGKSVYLCCPDCIEDAAADPAEILARVEELKLQKVGMQDKHDRAEHDHHNHDDHEHDDHKHHHDEHDGHDDRDDEPAEK